MDIEVRYFAAAREAAGCAGERVTVAPGSRVGDVAAHLVERHPGLAGALPSLRFALDQEFVAAATPLAEGAVLALIPPVGGG